MIKNPVLNYIYAFLNIYIFIIYTIKIQILNNFCMQFNLPLFDFAKEG